MKRYQYICLRLNFILYLSLSSIIVRAQNQKNYFIHYGQKEGLYPNEIYQTYKSSNGFIWLRTEAGLIRFDGHNFINGTEVFIKSDKDISKFEGEGLFDNDKLVFSHLNTLIVCDLLTLRCKNFQIPEKLIRGKIYASHKRDYYFIAKEDKLYELNLQSKNFKERKLNTKNRINFVMPLNELLVVIYDNEIHFLDEKSKIVELVKHPNN